MSEMIERVRIAVMDFNSRVYTWRRKIDKTGYEVVHDTDPNGPISDETISVVFEGTEADCIEKVNYLRGVAVARAAIAAMREPTEAMLSAADFAGPDRYEPDGTTDAVWRAMIDAALNTTDPTPATTEAMREPTEAQNLITVRVAAGLLGVNDSIGVRIIRDDD